MSSKKNSSGSSIELTLLGIAFVVLKLCGVINWSWWWVLAPFWGGAAIFLLVLLAVFVYDFIKSR
jgi:hypothetical protein